MPKSTRLSSSFERRRVTGFRHPTGFRGSNSNNNSGGYRSGNSSRSSSRYYGGGGLPSSLDSPETSLDIASESYLRIKKRGALTWSTRYLLLRNSQLVWFACKQDADYRRVAQEIAYVQTGTLTTLKNELGLAIVLEDGREFIARAFNRGDLARWITAFQRLALKKETSLVPPAAAAKANDTTARRVTVLSTDDIHATTDDDADVRLSAESTTEAKSSSPRDKRRHVSFHNSVLVRMIPTVEDDQIKELFYSRKDMEKFSARASSLFCRTEEAVSCAYLSFRRPSTLSSSLSASASPSSSPPATTSSWMPRRSAVA